jgi:heme/copper-type cytochrome/quinol oxidase subunit 3
MYWFLIPLSGSLLFGTVWFIVSLMRKDDPKLAADLAKIGLGLTITSGASALAAWISPDDWKPLFAIASVAVGLASCGVGTARAVVQVHKDAIKRASGWLVTTLFLASAAAFAWSAWLALAPYQG